MRCRLDQDVPLVNAITGASYRLRPIYKLDACADNLEGIAAICNEPLVYQWCFQELCGGEPYPREFASDWLRQGIEGWKEGSHFVYIVSSLDGAVAAACDIKSSNLERSEIGYWSSSKHRGIMTNAVRAVTCLADAAGFKTLFAEVHPENRRSLAVIERAGFERIERQPSIEGHTLFERPRSDKGQR